MITGYVIAAKNEESDDLKFLTYNVYTKCPYWTEIFAFAHTFRTIKLAKDELNSSEFTVMQASNTNGVLSPRMFYDAGDLTLIKQNSKLRIDIIPIKVKLTKSKDTQHIEVTHNSAKFNRYNN